MSRYALSLLGLLALGCSSATSPAPEAATPTATAAAEAVPADVRTVAFSVPGMTCPGGCAPVVKRTLEGLPGVVKCEVDFDTKTAMCSVEKDAQFESEAAVAALGEAGFKGSTLKP